MGDDVSKAKREQGCSADVEVGAQLCPVAFAMDQHSVAEGRTHGKVKQSEAEDEKNGPQEEKQKQRERTVDAVDLVA